jgi:hypothetical protein
MHMKIFFAVFCFSIPFCLAQDTISYPWPVTPFSTSQSITGTFCEFRNTLSSNHFHNGADIPKADGSPVYAVLDGTVSTISPSSVSGTSAYVRVTGTVNGVSKNMAYVHIEPNPALTLGQAAVKGVTILGYILTGQGHTHLIDGAFNSETNPLRKTGGIEPFIDTWKPKVISVEFYQDNSSIRFTNNKVFGLFDIVAQMVEVNANALPNSGSTSNNGVYHTGYKIYSADKSTVVYNPGVNGVRYKFDWKPNDDNSNVVYTLTSSTSQHIYYLTNGTGNIGTSRLQSVGNSAFNSLLLPAGQYQAMVYAQDTHGNADTVFVPFEISTQDVVAPANPVLKSVLNDSTHRVTVSWYANTEPDLKGYRLYSSLNGTTWILQKDESTLKPNMTSYSFSGITTTSPVYFRMTAVDSAAITNESGISDSYGLRPNLAGGKVLVIDAFDRTGGSYKKLFHSFAMTAGQSVATRFETVHNRAVTDGSISLSDYAAVVWLFGDESSTDETFGETEQAKAIAYLKAGGKLFVSGSEVAYDLDRASGPSQADRDFFNIFLKADYAGDASSSYTVNGTGFMNGVTFGYGDTLQESPYREDFPDFITAFGGSVIAANYANALGAMTAFSGTFAGGTSPGAVVMLCLPFETIHTKAERDAVMGKVLNYFSLSLSVSEKNDAPVPMQYSLDQNFPNPFNPTTVISFQLPAVSYTTLTIFDILGKEIAVLVNETKNPGKYSVQWNAAGFASGIYFYRLQTENFTETKKFVLMR